MKYFERDGTRARGGRMSDHGSVLVRNKQLGPGGRKGGSLMAELDRYEPPHSNTQGHKGNVQLLNAVGWEEETPKEPQRYIYIYIYIYIY